MKRYTQKELRRLVASGASKDVTLSVSRADIPECYTQVGYSAGVYGCNGMLWQGAIGQLYAATRRTKALWIF